MPVKPVVKTEVVEFDQCNADTIVLGMFTESQSDGDLVFKSIDAVTDGLISQLIEDKSIKLGESKTTEILRPRGLRSNRLIIVGLGKKATFSSGVAYRTAATGALKSAGKEHDTVAYFGWLATPELAESSVAGSLTGCVGQDLFKKKAALHQPQTIKWIGFDETVAAKGEKIATAINLTRRLINLPANYIYPETFVEEVSKVASPLGLEIEVWDRDKLAAEGCGSMLAVARGSKKEPKLMMLKHKGSGVGDFKYALVGKGVTFDSGGLSLKPSGSMLTMKCDMGGAATVAGIMCGIAALEQSAPCIGLVGLVENMISDDCYRLGDILTARNGKTIEIHNTDAEGRLVLADVLDVACDYKPEHLIDFATLTGACVVALGTDIVGAMTNDNPWQQKILDAAQQCDELVWPLPMHEFFSEQILSKTADIKNVGEGRWGGAITAGKFLEEFVREISWTHLDIAGPAFFDSPKSWCDAGASGVMVRSIMHLLRD